MSLNRAQRRAVLVGAALVAVVLLFPPWIQREGHSKIQRGRHWIGSPPERVGPEHFWDGVVRRDDPRAEWRQQRRQRRADALEDPEIDGREQDMPCFALLVAFASLVYALRGRDRQAEREAADETAKTFR